MKGFDRSDILKSTYNHALAISLKKLDIQTRNKVRAINSSNEVKAIKILNGLRKNLSVNKLVDVEKAINAYHGSESVLPELFPVEPQTYEAYIRLDPLPLGKALKLVERLVEDNFDLLKGLVSSLSVLNKQLVTNQYLAAYEQIHSIFEDFGYSHFLFRKLVLLRELSQDKHLDQKSSDLLNKATSRSKVITLSLIHCYQDEQDYLGIKKSIMGLTDNGDSNQFTRDIARLPFHVHAINVQDLEEMIQSNLQSSLLDAILIIKSNHRFLESSAFRSLKYIVEKIDSSVPTLDEILELYVHEEDAELLFFKQSSAWMESNKVIEYRYLVDHFYDYPESSYFSLNPNLVDRISNYVQCGSIDCLLSGERFVDGIGEVFHQVQQDGFIARSAIFNYLVFTMSSELEIKSSQIFSLMSQTSALDRTVHVQSLSKILPMLESDLDRIILRLLIAKKSRSESDHVSLKSLMERHLKSNYEGDLVKFIEYISVKSSDVAFYLYDTCNEDFIARMTRVIKKASEITETRAELHMWRGEFTGESIYLDRARNIRIDSQINRIRGEIDDNRIYADTNRFSEWFNDNISTELSQTLLVIDNNEGLNQVDNPQLYDIIERCFDEFCTSSFFGIASYLGRRIRHGTFRGFLFSDVVNKLENKYSEIILGFPLSTKWLEWKKDYEAKVMNIINEKLHIRSQVKKNGFLFPDLRNPAKISMARKCIVNVIDHYKSVGNVVGVEAIVIEYCWRIAEIDLKSFNSFIKGQKPNFVNGAVFGAVSNLNLSGYESRLVHEFERELQKLVSDRLNTICSWFKKPHTASSKVSLNLLYRAVVSEVQQTFDSFEPNTDFEVEDDIELYGGVYHIFYDALFVIIFNAAKHGKHNGEVIRRFYTERTDGKVYLRFIIMSEINDEDDESFIESRLRVDPGDDLKDAQVVENRSGIKKLHNLQIMDPQFKVDSIYCRDRYVTIRLSYDLGA